jgi:hypothetical protein
MRILPQVKAACWGAIVGAVALAVIGFSWGGWVTGPIAEATAKQRAESALVDALAPICADKFRQQANAGVTLDEMKKISARNQGSFIERGGWATLPGSTSPNAAVARACAEILGRSRS